VRFHGTGRPTLGDARRDDPLATNPSIFLRLNRSETAPRELAWVEFRARYAPVIVAFARRFGVTSHDADDVVQDVLVGFYAKSPTFVYDPSRGRFRAYLKACTIHALRKHLAAARGRGVAKHLLGHAFHLDASTGRAGTILHVDSNNPTPALGLYESVGMRPVLVIDVWRGRFG